MKPWNEKTFEQRVATVVNEEQPRWWNSLSDKHRVVLKRDIGQAMQKAFEAGVAAGMRADAPTLAALQERLALAVEGFEEIKALAPSYEPILADMCPDGCLPTPGMERQATILAQPFIVARVVHEKLTASEQS
jgi:hypothetical protein